MNQSFENDLLHIIKINIRVLFKKKQISKLNTNYEI